VFAGIRDNSMSRKDEYIGYFIKYNNQLFNFILTLVPNYSDAEDILQKSASIMWEKFDTYQRDTYFLAWARKIIRLTVSNYYRTKRHEFQFDDQMLDALTAAHEKESKHSEEQLAALTVCLSKLEPSDLDLIRMRFYERFSVPEIASKTNRNLHTLYKRIPTIFILLHNCIKRTLMSEDLA